MGKSSAIRYDPAYCRRVSAYAISNSDFSATNKEIAALLGCCEKTVIEWRKRHIEFAEVCEQAALAPNIAVESAIYKAACGHYAEEEVTAYKYIRDEQTGKRIEVPVTKEIRRRYIPPNPAAQNLWAYNRMADKYKRKVEQTTDLRIVTDAGADEELTQILAEAHAAAETESGRDINTDL